MTNQDQAAQVIRTWQQRHKNVMDSNPDWAAQNLAIDLHNAGLITPDLPERPDSGIWGELGQFLVDTADNGGVAVAPPHPGIVTLDSKEARETALALLAAANHTEEE